MDQIPHLLIGSVERAPWGWVLMLTVVLALIKAWPVIQLQADNARALMRGEKRDDLHQCTEELRAMRTEMDTFREQVHQLDLKLVGTVTAYRILHTHVTKHAPDSSDLVQARLIFRQTWDDDGISPDWLALLDKAPAQ